MIIVHECVVLHSD